MDEKTKELISKSQLSTYSFCPRQYKLRYVDGIKSETNPTLARGSRIHAFMDSFHEIAKSYEPSSWYSFIHDDFTPDEKIMLKYLVNYEWNRWESLDHDVKKWMPVLHEQMIVNEELGLRGIIDRVDKIEDKYIIVEYKTSKSNYKPSLQKEFGFYKYLLNHTEPYSSWDIPLGLVINPRIGQFEYMAPSREDTIIKLIDKIKQSKLNGEFPPSCTEAKNAICGLCSIEDAQLFE